ncbi:hypothetical protein TNCV_3470341 [Trichonephila clavipes]|nr:hypothetical protein TNCV_3470341 [Trichonephila clavipes]
MTSRKNIEGNTKGMLHDNPRLTVREIHIHGKSTQLPRPWTEKGGNTNISHSISSTELLSTPHLSLRTSLEHVQNR